MSDGLAPKVIIVVGIVFGGVFVCYGLWSLWSIFGF